MFGHFVGLALKRVIGKVGYLRAFAAFAFSEIKSKKEKIFTWTYSQKNASDGVLCSTVAALRAYNFMKRGLHLRCFCEICEVLHNLIFTGGSWTTASHCCISNKSNPDCLSRTSTTSCSQAIHSVCLENI